MKSPKVNHPHLQFHPFYFGSLENLDIFLESLPELLHFYYCKLVKDHLLLTVIYFGRPLSSFQCLLIAPLELKVFLAYFIVSFAFAYFILLRSYLDSFRSS